ncbi:ribonuclease D [Arcanobacterium pluranimalium]|uniref:HRDC domain-containing protein n=1 Tax=Arcanobacterium pluranimalium TaxID=108028 RepID=UPI00195AC6C5|nr:HRDC domain-containing protein [Arcanobacterium pluranimalium]MBM7825490.1 ribonuclease D [Arcanobacterium pluranimalium]
MTPSDNREAIPLLEPRGGTPEITHNSIDDALRSLSQGRGAFAIDTERAMGIRYSNRAYLVQIKRENTPIFLIDPIGVEDQLIKLTELLNDEWILHAADQDLPCLAELNLRPAKVFDTEIAGLLLGFERVSLQAMVAELLNVALAKEHSSADWSQRPLSAEMRAYAALDVDVLHELKDHLIPLLENSGRLEWHEQECEAVRTRPPAAPKQQPWRKAARQAGIRDRRALAMVEQLWNTRDELGRHRDVSPSKVLPSKILAELASRKPRSRADVLNSTLLRSRIRSKDAVHWWEAIDRAWHLKDSQLPERHFQENKDPFPPVKRWENLDPQAAQRWNRLRSAILTHADELGIRQDMLLKPAIQKFVAWQGWASASELHDLLAAQGARPWQIAQAAPVIFTAVQ